MPRALLLFLLACAAAPAGRVGPAAPTVLSDAQRARDAALAAAFVDAFANFAPWPLKDGGLVFLSTRDGIPTLYAGDARAKSAAPRRLIAANERVGGYSVLPGEHAVLFLSDVKSDENFSVELSGWLIATGARAPIGRAAAAAASAGKSGRVMLTGR